MQRYILYQAYGTIDHIDGDLLYCDTDTYITRPVENLFQEIEQGTFVMHEYEGILDKSVNPDFYKWEKFLEAATIEYNGKKVNFSKQLGMWNAGSIGMNKQSKYLLEDTLALTDTVYQQFPKHIAEQFAFSYCFQKAGKVTSAGDQIFHYWNLKEFRQLLRQFFVKNEEESIPNLVKLVHNLDAAAIQKSKMQFEQLPFYKKWMQFLFGKRWNIKQYENKI